MWLPRGSKSSSFTASDAITDGSLELRDTSPAPAPTLFAEARTGIALAGLHVHPDAIAFWRVASRIAVGDGCWEWQGRRNPGGYGKLGKSDYAHRAAYELLVGPIPEGLELDHICRNHGCVRPAHLEPVTHSENVRRGDAASMHRDKTHCPKGHPYDEANTYRHGGRRFCRACDLLRTRRRRMKG